MKTEKFTEKESLEVIREMILRSKQNFSSQSGYFLVWGWAILLATLTHYLAITFQWGINPNYLWPVAIGIPFIYTIIISIRPGHEKKTTFVDQVLTSFWGSSPGVWVILVLLGINYGWIIIYPVFIVVYGWGTLTSGVLMRFRPMVVAGIFSFFIGGLAVFVQTKEILLIMSFAILVTYLIPGYMLKYHKS